MRIPYIGLRRRATPRVTRPGSGAPIRRGLAGPPGPPSPLRRGPLVRPQSRCRRLENAFVGNPWSTMGRLLGRFRDRPRLPGISRPFLSDRPPRLCPPLPPASRLRGPERRSPVRQRFACAVRYRRQLHRSSFSQQSVCSRSQAPWRDRVRAYRGILFQTGRSGASKRTAARFSCGVEDRDFAPTSDIGGCHRTA